MACLFEGKIFSGGQRDLRCQKSLYNRVIGKVQKHNYMVRGAAFFKGSAEKFCNVIFDTHCGEYNCKIFVRVISKRCLLYDLCGKLIVRKTISGKNRKLLSADQGSKTINRGDSCIDIVSWIFTFDRIQRKSVDVQTYLRCDLAQSVNRAVPIPLKVRPRFLRKDRFPSDVL